MVASRASIVAGRSPPRKGPCVQGDVGAEVDADADAGG
jgi:hypothetical protein